MLGGWKRLADPCSQIAQAVGLSYRSRVLRTTRRLKVTAVETQTEEDRHEYGRPEEIPGPRSLPFIGTIYKYAPFFGEYSFKNYTQTAKRRYESYGKIVREEIFPGLMHYHVYDPKDIETMFREEGKTPMRIQLEGFKEYRLDRRHSPGLANSDGEDWYKLRSAVQQPMMRHSSVNSYMSMQFPVADDMVRNIRHLRDPLTAEVPDFLNELYKWAMESIAVVIFGDRIGCMELDLPRDSVQQRFIDAVGSAFQGIESTTLYWPMHKKKNTKVWTKLCEDMDFIYDVFLTYAEKCIERNNDPTQEPIHCLLQTMLNNGKLSTGDGLTISADFFFGGVDTTAHSVGFNLFHLAKNPNVQERLFKEIQEKIPRNATINPSTFNNMPYLKAVIKETFRLTPTITTLTRITVNDIVLSGYKIPKGSPAAVLSSRHLHTTTWKPQSLPRAQYGGRHRVTILPGDGVGPEMMSYVKQVFGSIGAPVDFEEVQLDHTSNDADFDYAIMALKRNGVALKGNVESMYSEPGYKSRNVELRAELDLFANVVWCRSIPGVHTRHNNIDAVIIRENTEGEYSQLEHESADGVVESLKIITKKNSTRIAKYAFDFAVTHGRKKVTAVHKANIMKLGDGLFLQCCEEVSEQYPNIEFNNMIVDNCSMQMVSRPEQFDVLVLPNLYGNILGNIGTGLVGGAGVVSGVNIGDKYAVFEMGTRNTGKKIAGKNIANPSAILIAAADMLDYLGLSYHAGVIKDAIYQVLSVDKVHTPDLGGNASTLDVVNAVMAKVKSC